MSLNIEKSAAMTLNQTAFAGKEKLLSKIKRNMLYTPKQQAFVKELLKSDTVNISDKKQLLLMYRFSSDNIFVNLAGNLSRILRSKL